MVHKTSFTLSSLGGGGGGVLTFTRFSVFDFQIRKRDRFKRGSFSKGLFSEHCGISPVIGPERIRCWYNKGRTIIFLEEV